MAKHYFILTLCVFVCLAIGEGKAQHVKLQAGVQLGYSYVSAKNFDQGAKLFTFLNTQQSKKLFPVTNGFHVGIFAAFTPMYGLQIEPNVSYQYYWNNGEGTYGNISFSYKQVSVRPIVNIYFLNFFKLGRENHIHDKLFLQFIPSYTYSTVGISRKVPDTFPTGTYPDFSSKSKSFGIGAGVGYDFFYSEKISVTPYFQFQYLPSVQAPGVQDALIPVSLPDKPSDESKMHTWQVGVKVGYIIKPMIPLCPMTSCHVSLHHRHKELGDKLWRGNELNKPQNTHIGEKYVRPERRFATKWSNFKKGIPFLNRKKKKKKADKNDAESEPVTTPSSTETGEEGGGK